MRSARVVIALSVVVSWLLTVGVPDGALAQKARPAPRKERTGKLDVKVSVDGATVFVDGAEIGTTPMGGPVTLATGTHTLKVSKPGHAEFLDTVNIGINETTTVEVDLVPFNAVVNVLSDPPGAEVTVDGKLQGDTPARLELPPGAHTVRVSLDGYTDAEQSVQVVAGESYDVSLTLVAVAPPPTPKKSRKGKPVYKKWWFWAASGAVAAGVTAIAIAASSGGDPLDGADKVLDVKF